MSVRDDAETRWRAGRAACGWGPWQGRAPLAELYEELLDAINYLTEHGRQVPAEEAWAECLAKHVERLAEQVRERLPVSHEKASP